MEISSAKASEPPLLELPLLSNQDHELKNRKVQLYYPKRSDHGTSASQRRNQKYEKYISKEGVERFEAGLYTSEFQFRLFLKALLLSLLYSFGIGAFIVPIIKRIIFKNFIHNYLLIKSALILSILSIVSSVHLVYRILDGSLFYFDTLSLSYYGGLIFFSIGVASIPGYTNKVFAQLFSSVKLNDGSFDNRYGFGFHYSSELAQEEVEIAISRLNLDEKSFYLTVFEENIAALRKGSQEEDVKNLNILETEREYIFTQMVDAPNFINKSVEFEKNLFLFLFKSKFPQENRPEDDKTVSGYNIAEDLISNTVDDQTFVNISLIKSMLSLIFLITINIIYFEEEDSQSSLIKWVRIVFWIIFSMLPQCFVLFSMSSVIDIMESKYQILKQLKSFISTQKKPRYAGTFINSYTLNILDLQSLKSWMSLRRIFLEFGQQKIQSATRGILIIFFVQFMVMPVGIYLNSRKDIDYSGYFRFYYIQSIIYIATLLMVVYIAGKINKRYKSHRKALQANKQQIGLLFKTYPNIQQYNSVLSKNFMEMVDNWKNEFGEGCLENKMNEKMNILFEAYDFLIEEIEFEEIYHPVRIFGIAIRLW